MTAPKSLAAGLSIIVAACAAGRALPTEMPRGRRRRPTPIHGTKWHLVAKGPVVSQEANERIVLPEDRTA